MPSKVYPKHVLWRLASNALKSKELTGSIIGATAAGLTEGKGDQTERILLGALVGGTFGGILNPAVGTMPSILLGATGAQLGNDLKNNIKKGSYDKAGGSMLDSNTRLTLRKASFRVNALRNFAKTAGKNISKNLGKMKSAVRNPSGLTQAGILGGAAIGVTEADGGIANRLKGALIGGAAGGTVGSSFNQILRSKQGVRSMLGKTEDLFDKAARVRGNPGKVSRLYNRADRAIKHGERYERLIDSGRLKMALGTAAGGLGINRLKPSNREH